MAEEPTENISGGDAGGGRAAEFDPATAATRAERVVDRLGELYWQKTYGGRAAFECLVRTVLSQNTSDVASQPAHDALVTRYGDGAAGTTDGTDDGDSAPGMAAGDPAGADGYGGDRADGDGDLAAALSAADREALAETIAPAGLHNQKSETLVRLADRVVDEYDGADGFDAFVRGSDPGTVREALLDMKGVGPKTADCVLLFAGGREGVFPVDTHVHRIARRIGLAPADADHETVRDHLEAAVPAEKCGFGHTAMIQFGREYCTARRPACLDDPEACPMADCCDQVGVSPETGVVEDPAAAPDTDR
jgi:endonuclease-3